MTITRPVKMTTPVVAFSNEMMCPKCGTFAKSGRTSCCAPAGAWYKNCGAAGNRRTDYRWFEGVEACTRKSKTNAIRERSLHMLSFACFSRLHLFAVPNASIYTQQ